LIAAAARERDERQAGREPPHRADARADFGDRHEHRVTEEWP